MSSLLAERRQSEVDVVTTLLDLAARTEFYAASSSSARNGPSGGWERLALLPLTTVDDLLDHKLKSGSPYSGRRTSPEPALVAVQLEYATETPLYVGLDRTDLQLCARALESCFRLLGVRSGDTLAFYDHGTSPVVYLASSLYTPYLTEGAADRLGCTVVCNDGEANFSHRAVEIVEYTRPRFFFVRDDCLEPFVTACRLAGLELAKYTEAVVATHNEGALPHGRKVAAARHLGVPVHRLPRSDVAMFLALECGECGCVHVPRDLYHAETVEIDGPRPTAPAELGRLVVTNIAAHGILSLRMLTSLEGVIVDESCGRSRGDALVRLR